MRTASALVCVLLPGLLWAAPAAPDKDDKPVDKVRQALDQAVTLHVEKQTLAAAVEALHKQCGLHVSFDGPAIQQQLGFAPEQSPAQVDVDVKGVKARSVLRTILAPYNLSFAVIGDTVVVTTEDAAVMRQMRQHVSVDLSKVELAAALRQIGRDTATNLIVDARAEKEAKVEVTLQLEDVPLETAVRLLSEVAGLKPVRVGNTLFVTKKETAAAMRNDPDFAPPNPAVPVEISNGYLTTPINAVGGGRAFINTVPVFAPVTAPAPAPNPPAVTPGSGTGAAAPPNPKLGDQDAPKPDDKTPTEKKEDK